MSMTVLERFHGGQRWMLRAAAVGGLGLAATAAGALWDVRTALFAYLFSFAYWLGLCLGTLILLAALQAAASRWFVVLKRALEIISVTCPLFVLLFLPIGMGMGKLFLWVHPPAELGPHALHLIEHRRLYLNVPFFLVRAAIYFAAWCGVGQLLYLWSTRQDENGELSLTLKQRRLASGALPILGLTLSFAATDWLMSLEPHWYSTIFSLYYFAGAFVGAIALLIIVSVLARDSTLFGHFLTPAHYARLGKLLLAFVCFWAYIAFSQFMLVWAANLPEEIPWYRIRLGESNWGWIGLFLALGHFVLPFFLLLSRRLKEQPRRLAAIAVWILVAHAADTYWLVMPALRKHGPIFTWMLLTAFVGVGGVAVAFAVWRARGNYAVPVRDPFLFHSLHAKKS